MHGKDKVIIFAAGGTGGHVFPAVSLADEMVSRGYRCMFITDNRGIKYLPDKYKLDAYKFYSRTYPRILLYMFLILNIARFFVKFLFCRKKIGMVVGFGGYPSVPPTFAAQILGIKTVVHEQNAVIGKANALLCRMANIAIMSFDGVQSRCKNTVYVGNPTRFDDEYKNCCPKTYTNTATVLIIGGSQGAKIFSTVVVKAIAMVAKTKDIFVYHQVLQEDLVAVTDLYDKLKIKHVVKPFFDNIGDLYKESDLVISRSGASSVFEIIGFAKPSILIPLLQSINGDQTYNALYLYNRNAAEIYWEDRMTDKDMADMILKIIQDLDVMTSMSNNLALMRIEDTKKKICDIICKSC